MSFEVQYDRICHSSRSRVLATLVRLLGGLDDAEDATQDAFTAALLQWPREGIPENPCAWLISVGRYKHLDRRRRDSVLPRILQRTGVVPAWVHPNEAEMPEQEQLLLAPELMKDNVIDDRLRLIFTCCHPALSDDAQVAITLRTLAGLSTSAIAGAFLVSEAAMSQRIVRAKAKIKDAGIPYTVPSRKDLPERMQNVLQVVYLIFNQGYGDARRNSPMASEAIRLGRVLLELLPSHAEVRGLLALMLLQHARAPARCDARGNLIVLEEQDRTLWDGSLIEEGAALAAESLRAELTGYGVQAAIAALHGRAREAHDTDWAQIEALYSVLQRLQPSPVVELNRAVAIAMQNKTSEAFALVEALGGLEDYCPYWAAKAYLLVRNDRMQEASIAYRRAAELATMAAQKRYLEQRSAEVLRTPLSRC